MRTARPARQPSNSAAVLAFVVVLLLSSVSCTRHTDAPAAAAAPPADNSIVLNASQLGALKLAIVGTRHFKVQHSAVGTIDFDENAAVQVFSPYAGRIIQAFADIGEDVARGRTLYTIDSPDLLQAESTLITAAGQADLTAAALARAQDLYAHEGMAQKDYQQAVSDDMSAQGALKATRDAVRIFGKTDGDIDAMIVKRKVDSTLVIPSPIAGRVTARFAQPGLLVQPGNTPAPYTVADLGTLWMLANVPESEVALLRVGQAVTVTVASLDGQEFQGSIKTVGESLDPNTHTAVVRSEVRDPQHRLRPGMMATFVIQTGEPADSVALPVNGVVREGDGTMSVWVTTDRQKFIRRTVIVGLQQDGFDQIQAGLRGGELAVTDGAILLSNLLSGSGGDD